MEGSPVGSRRWPDEQEFNLTEWHLRARISRENTNSRRYSASYIRSFREESRSFRSNFTISSTASSPGYNLKDEIDPSTYSFSTALKALQAKSGYVWEYVSPDEGFSLSSKWDEAERFISNPLSGEVPMECLSAKTLSGRSFRGFMASRVTMSAPLVFSSQNQHRRPLNNSTNKPLSSTPVLVIKEPSPLTPDFPIYEKVMGRKTRDRGTKSNPQEGEEEEGSRSPSPTSTPLIKERPLRHSKETEDCDTQNSSSSIKLKHLVDEVEVKVTREEEETKRRNKEGEKKKMKKKNQRGQLCICKQSGGCLLLSWRSLWMKKRQREKHKIPSFHNQTTMTTTMSTIELDKSNTKLVNN